MTVKLGLKVASARGSSSNGKAGSSEHKDCAVLGWRPPVAMMVVLGMALVIAMVLSLFNEQLWPP